MILKLNDCFRFAGGDGSGPGRYRHATTPRLCAEWRVAVFKEPSSGHRLAAHSGKGDMHVIAYVLCYVCKISADLTDALIG